MDLGFTTPKLELDSTKPRKFYKNNTTGASVLMCFLWVSSCLSWSLEHSLIWERHKSRTRCTNTSKPRTPKNFG